MFDDHILGTEFETTLDFAVLAEKVRLSGFLSSLGPYIRSYSLIILLAYCMPYK